MPTAILQRPLAFTMCGRKWCQVHPKREAREQIEAAARADAQFDREEFGSPDWLAHLRDGFGDRGWACELVVRRSAHGRECCEWLSRFRQRGTVEACDSCLDAALDVECAWGVYQTTYEAAFAAKG